MAHRIATSSKKEYKINVMWVNVNIKCLASVVVGRAIHSKKCEKNAPAAAVAEQVQKYKIQREATTINEQSSESTHLPVVTLCRRKTYVTFAMLPIMQPTCRARYRLLL